MNGNEETIDVSRVDASTNGIERLERELMAAICDGGNKPCKMTPRSGFSDPILIRREASAPRHRPLF
ncbi:hypothetical protein [Novosphingobium terrae]|uniref:hypothetical protein n=1 Tax=Novosphingobium terrae TaxID=2726189 RepID=UPI00389B35EB